MDDIRDRFHGDRRLMIDAFVGISDLARRAGADEDRISELHGAFFDGNVAAKTAFRDAVLLAELRGGGHRT